MSITAQPPSGQTDELRERGRRRFSLRRRAAQLVPLERVARCGRKPFASTVDLCKHAGAHLGSVKGVETCGSVWMCPVCASKISERRREELAAAVRRGEELGHRWLLVTYTIQHNAHHSLKSSLDGLLAALKAVASCRAGREFRERHGFRGMIKDLEITHGSNGWHPHVHMLMLVDPSTDPEQFCAELRILWQKCVHLKAMRTVNAHGIDVQAADMTVAEYVTKFGRERRWGLESEAAKSVVKMSKGSSRSPLGLLEAAEEGCDASAALWREYAGVMKGKRQLTWSKGLRAYLGLSDEASDEEIAAEEAPGGECVLQISSRDWERVWGNDAVYEVLEVAGTGDVARLWFVLDCLGCTSMKPPD